MGSAKSLLLAAYDLPKLATLACRGDRDYCERLVWQGTKRAGASLLYAYMRGLCGPSTLETKELWHVYIQKLKSNQSFEEAWHFGERPEVTFDALKKAYLLLIRHDSLQIATLLIRSAQGVRHYVHKIPSQKSFSSRTTIRLPQSIILRAEHNRRFLASIKGYLRHEAVVDREVASANFYLSLKEKYVKDGAA